ncbi:MAG: recombinase family protein [Bdellovibrionales bacterium]|nr:recombinase family protein [Bdellovibrionales bacterium]
MSVWSVIEPLAIHFKIDIIPSKIKLFKTPKGSNAQAFLTKPKAEIVAGIKQLIEWDKCDFTTASQRLGISETTVRRVCRTLKIGNYVTKAQGAIVSKSSQAPFGWDVVNGQLRPNKKEWKWVLKIHQLRAEGKTLQQIVDILDQKNVHTKNGGRWFRKTISQILNFNKAHLKKSVGGI